MTLLSGFKDKNSNYIARAFECIGVTFTRSALIIVFILVAQGRVFGQEVKFVPDGTEGEVLEILDTSSAHKKPKHDRWRLFNGRFTTFKLGGGFLYEYAGYSQDEKSRKQLDSAGTVLESDFKVRDFRLVFSGQLKTKRTITWKAGIMYDGPNREWLVRETGVMVAVPELWGHVFVGRTKEGFSLNKVMNGYAGWTMERQMAIDVIPILADGIKWLGYLPEQRLFWNVGIYTDWLSHSQNFSTYKWQIASRFGWLPVYSPENNKLIHLGMSFRYGRPDKGEIRVRSRPETNPAPYFIDTENFPAQHSTQFGIEAYYSSGPWMFGSEYYVHGFGSPEKENPKFNGGEIVASWIFTGESRPYSTVSGIYAFVPVKKSVFKGGPGALEAVLRVSHLDLDDGLVSGGKFWRITPMINWYLSGNVRFELTYGYGVLDRFGLKGATQFFQSRIQLTLL